MPKPFPREVRDDVVAIALTRDWSLAQNAKDFGLSESYASERGAWRVCSQLGIFSAFVRTKRGTRGLVRPPVRGDLARRDGLRLAIVTWLERTYHPRCQRVTGRRCSAPWH